MSSDQTTKSTADIICEMSDSITAKRYEIQRLRLALDNLLFACERADPEEAIFPQQMEAARLALGRQQ